MPPTSTVATNLPPRPPPSSIVEPVQRSPVLSPKVADPRQHRSGSVLPSSPPRRPSTPPQQAPDEKTENGSQNSGPIDEVTFNQILELEDDDESFDFVWGMATAYFDQAEATFKKMETAITNKDCKTLYGLGHYLKGSSAALGVTKVQSSCESIQSYGQSGSNKGSTEAEIELALSEISAALKDAKEQYKEAEAWLRTWYSGVTGHGQSTKEDKGK